ncbi:MAG TPA: chemotaxis protein CheW [Rhodocyclaceae bacterium]|nr:chemotaxis protein CheW [Rhodocyclaceae bacterium]
MSNQIAIDRNQQEGHVSAESRQYLTFSLSGEMFAVGTLAVKEIIEYGSVTTVPMMPAFIRGVINLRGAVVPVIDLGVRFRNAPTEITRRSCIVILEIQDNDETQTLSVVVDAVNEVLEISPVDIEPPPAFGAKIRTDFIAGMAKVTGSFVILLNVGKILSIDEIASLIGVAEKSALPDHASAE